MPKATEVKVQKTDNFLEEPKISYPLNNGIKNNKSVHVLQSDKLLQFYGLQGSETKQSQPGAERPNNTTPLKAERLNTISSAAINTSRLLNSGLAKVDRD